MFKNAAFKRQGAALLAIMATSIGTAHSQDSTITLGGRLDLSLNSLQTTGQNGKTRNGIASDTSYFYLMGTERLSSDLRAVWRLESGFQADTGNLNNTALFNRLSYVGIEHKTLGQLVVGETFTPFVNVTSKFDPFRRSRTGALFTLFQGPANRGATGSVVQNSVSYVATPGKEWTVRLHYRLPEGDVTTGYVGSVEYQGGRLALSAIYDNIRINASSVGLTAGGSTRSETLGVGALYDFGPARVSLWGQINHVSGLPDAHGLLTGVAIPVGGGEIGASYAILDREGGNASLATLGYSYALSKRTTLYTTTSYLANRGRSTFDVWPLSQGSTPPMQGQDVKAFQIGMRHLF